MEFDQVIYDTNGFLEKNRDPMHSEFIHLLSSSGCQLPKSASLSCQSGGLESSMQSVGTKFKVDELLFCIRTISFYSQWI